MALTLNYPFQDDPTLAAATDPVDETVYGPTLSITRATDGSTIDSDGWIRTMQSD